MPIFRVKSVEIYSGQKKFAQAPLVALVTNIRYEPRTDKILIFKQKKGENDDEQIAI